MNDINSLSILTIVNQGRMHATSYSLFFFLSFYATDYITLVISPSQWDKVFLLLFQSQEQAAQRAEVSLSNLTHAKTRHMRTWSVDFNEQFTSVYIVLVIC